MSEEEKQDAAVETVPKPAAKAPLKSSEGIWANLNISISKEEIDEARREMWANFPREHFFDNEQSSE